MAFESGVSIRPGENTTVAAGKIREREWRQMAIEIIAVSRYSWSGRPLDGRRSISAVARSVRRLNRRCLYRRLLSVRSLPRSLAILYFIVRRLYPPDTQP